MAIKAKYSGSKVTHYDNATHETVLPIAPVTYSDDFFGAAVVIPAAGSPESGVDWTKKIVGAAPPTVAGVADAGGGVVACTLTATSEKQGATLYHDDQRNFDLSKGVVFEARVKPSVLPTGNSELVIGLLGDWADGEDAATYSAFFTLDGSGEIFCETDDNVTDASATSAVTLAATDWAILRIDFSDLTDVKFYVNGERVAAGTTFAYAATGANAILQPVAEAYKVSGTGVGTLQVDYIRIWSTR